MVLFFVFSTFFDQINQFCKTMQGSKTKCPTPEAFLPPVKKHFVFTEFNE